jgi:hypothetical protein
MAHDILGGISVTPPTDIGSGSGEGPTTPRECYSEGSVNPSLLDYDYGILTSVVGPIEICVNGRYESLCDIGWDQLDAEALCRRRIGSNSGTQLFRGDFLLSSLILSHIGCFFFTLTQWLNHFVAWGFLRIQKDMLQGRLTALHIIMVWETVGTHLTLIQSAIMELMLQE